MKKIISLMFSILVCFKSFCQADSVNRIPVKQETDYSQLIQKSKNQKTAAFIMLGGGTVMSITGIILWGNEEDRKDSWFLGYNDWLILAGVGTTAAILSAPMFRVARKNRKAAAKLSASVKMEKASFVQRFSLTKVNYPAVSLKLNL